MIGGKTEDWIKVYILNEYGTVVDGRPVYKLSGPSAAIARRPESKKPVEEYLKTQGRFRHIFKHNSKIRVCW